MAAVPLIVPLTNNGPFAITRPAPLGDNSRSAFEVVELIVFSEMVMSVPTNGPGIRKTPLSNVNIPSVPVPMITADPSSPIRTVPCPINPPCVPPLI